MREVHAWRTCNAKGLREKEGLRSSNSYAKRIKNYSHCIVNELKAEV